MNRFYRSRSDKKIFGLCGGLAEKFNVDPTLLRLIVVVTAFFSGGTVIAVYIIASLVIPLESDQGRMSTYGWDEQPIFGMKHASAGSRSSAASYDPRADHVQAKPQSYTTSGSAKLDDRMKDIEQKALRDELEQLRAKLARYEKGES